MRVNRPAGMVPLERGENTGAPRELLMQPEHACFEPCEGIIQLPQPSGESMALYRWPLWLHSEIDWAASVITDLLLVHAYRSVAIARHNTIGRCTLSRSERSGLAPHDCAALLTL
jgi:hypothetical protein